MKINKKIFFSILLTIAMLLVCTKVHAASATISASKSTATVGDSVNINVNINAAAWNLKVNGNGINGDTIVGYDSDANNVSTSKSFPLNTSAEGTYTISLTGDITDADADNATPINKSVTVKVEPKASNSATTTTPTPTPKPTQAGKSNNANLSNLVISPVDFKGFKASKTTGYSVTVENDVTEVGVKATAQHSKAKVEISGNKILKVGENIVSVTVTAEDGKTKKTYKVIVNRKDIAENTTPVETEPEQEPETEPEEETSVEEKVLGISQIKITGTTGDEKSVELTFTPEFNSDIYEYTTIVPVEIKDINVEAKASIEDAAIEVMGNKDLVLGENVITILVKSADGTEQKSYQIIVTKTTESLKQDHTELIKKIIIITTITILVIAIIIAITVFKRGKKSQKIGTIGRDISIADEMLGKENQEVKKEEKPSSNDGNHGKRFK